MARNKFNVSPKAARTWNYRIYASKAEMEYARLLYYDQGVWVREQPRFELGCPENVYVADFLIVPTDDKLPYVVDVKGHETPKFRRDIKLWKRYGEYELRVVKYNYHTGLFDTTRIIHGGKQ